MPQHFLAPERAYAGASDYMCGRFIWLDPETSVQQAKDQLGRNPNRDLRFMRVGREVNQATFKGAECIRPVNPL